MRHLSNISTNRIPKKALLDGHPGLLESLAAFFEDPLGTIGLHFNKGG